MAAILKTILQLFESLPLVGKGWLWIKRQYIQRLSLQEIKNRAHVLFVDDKRFDVVDRIKDDGWSVDTIKDIKNLSDNKVVRATVIFVDYKGVGQHLSPKEEGLGLIKALKNTYPKKRVIFYSGYTEFSLDELHGNIADDVLPKNSEPFVYIEKIERNVKIALSS